jgi:NCAIR mutase (PurE)-related protein
MTEHWQPDEAMAAFIELDHDRARRRGYAEAVYCEGKTPAQVTAAARAIKASGTPTLFTRAGPAHAKGILLVLPEARYEEDAHMLAWPPEPPAPRGGGVLVVAAGTSDLGVAREAQLTAQYLGRAADLIIDVGIAGLQRILARLDQLRSARVIVVVAGMDGALPGLVAGLVSAPVIAVPTSVGYGVALRGLAPLLTMLNSCAPGVAVVNIDNGYGAGHLAAQIAAPT